MPGRSLKRIAIHVKNFRNSADLTQDELARKCGLSKRIVCWIETAHEGYSPDLSTIEALSTGLKKDILELFRPVP